MPLLLSDLPTDALEKVFEAVRLKFPLKYTCRALRAAHRKSTNTPHWFVLESIARFEWARGCGYNPTRDTVERAARLGKDDVVYWLIKGLRVEWCATHVSRQACAGGSIAVLEVLEELAEGEPSVRDELWPAPDESSVQMIAAAANGRCSVIRWLRERGHLAGWQTGAIASRNGQLDVLVLLKGTLSVKDATFVVGAAANGHTCCVAWLLGEGAPLTSEAMMAAAENGHVSTMRMLHQLGATWHHQTARVATRRDRLECVKFCVAEMNPPKWTDPNLMMDVACGADAVNVTRWQLESGRVTEVRKDHILIAICSNATKVLDLLFELGHVPKDDPDLCEIAARDGALDSLKLLRKHGCVWREGSDPKDPGIAVVALREHRDDVFKYLMENDACPWDQGICNQALSRGRLECLSWLLRSGRVPFDWEELRVYGLKMHNNIRITSYVTRGDHHVYDGWQPAPWEEGAHNSD